MSVLQREQTGLPGGDDKFRGKALLQASVTEAFALLSAGKRREAIAQISHFSGIAAQSSAGCYIFGVIYFNAGELRDALAWFERATGLQPGFAEAHSARAIVLQRLGQPRDALKSFEAVLELRPKDAETLFSIGVVLQSLGRITEALAAYDKALAESPSHCEALTNRGALLERFGRLDEALSCFDAIDAIRPGDSANLFNRGSVLQKLGRLEEALAAYEEAGRRGPPDADTELNRGNVLQRLGRTEEALSAYDLAAQYRPGYPQAYYNKGIALQALSRLDDALAAYENALTLNPSYYEASCNRGNVLYELGRHHDALEACAYTLRLRPGYLPALINRANILLQLERAEESLLSCDEVLRRDPSHPQCLGIRGAALQKLGRAEEALSCLDEAIRLNPLAPEAWHNRGNVLQELNRHTDAVASYREALRIKPDYPEALSGLGVALKELGRVSEALASLTEALKHKPGYADARNNRAGAFLLLGSLQEGFADFESRWDRSSAPPKSIVCDLPPWEGQELAGRKILVWDEQGLGDLIQFARYFICLAGAGAEVAFAGRKNMRRLLRSLPVPVRWIEAFDAADGFSFQCALMSLPYGFRTSLETVPAPVPYLFAEPALIAKWAGRIGADGFRIGIGWQGNKFVDPHRSIPLVSFAPLAAIPGVRLISLMKDQGPLEVEGPNGSFRIESPGRDMDAGPDSFTDCAAAMQTLDLIVTADTAIAHLAGALGRPVFVALKHAPDWRWMLEREDSPWYPTMRLFRQSERGDWDSVFHRIAAAVKARMEGAPGFPAVPCKSAAMISVPATAGDLIDRIAMLEAEAGRPGEPSRLEAAHHELAKLKDLRASCGFTKEIAAIEEELRLLNRSILEAEASLQLHRAGADFGTAAGCLARQLWKDNARRVALKQEINELFGSASREGQARPANPRLEAC